MSQAPSIACKPNGPYLVKGVADLRNAQGERVETRPEMVLCRCGGSAKKPFCDGTHRKNGFSGAKITDGANDRRESYRGKGITIHDNRSICAHAGHCSDGLASVFRYKVEPWIDPTGASVEAIIETVRRCPSGALSYTLDGDAPGEAARDPSITATKDGPLEIAGAVELIGEDWGEGASRTRYTLCRCGGSKNKPFCDGTHWSIGFKDPQG